MFNTVNGNGATVTEKLGLDSEVRELKFGSSFNPGNKGQQGAFHSIRYDFKPASVDKSKMATLEVGPSGQVTISMPHYDTNGSTVFKGSTRPYTKECVLIIDKDTGEVVLEKLSHNVQVKKTRQEKPERLGENSREGSRNSSKMPSTALPDRSSSSSARNELNPKEDKSKRHNSSIPPSLQQQQQYLHHTTSATIHRRPNSPMTAGPSRHSPISSLHGHNSPSSGNLHNNPQSATFDAIISSKQEQYQQPFMPSLTSIEDLLITQPTSNTGISKLSQPSHGSHSLNLKNPLPGDKNAGILSDSSSDSSSSSSSDEEDSSSISDMEEVSVQRQPETREKPAIHSPPMTMSMPSLSLSSGPSSQNPSMSMPSHLLSEDLQLSESGSDSE